ncbi:MAG: D-glycero-beta-D-manno-heptose 1-phosphate adenylyltransferase [Pseudomonadota bacterium]
MRRVFKQDATVLVLGDVILDCFVSGRAARVSPEAPALVLNVGEERFCLGGAANVANNVAALGGEAILIGAVGADHAADTVQRMCAETSGITPSLVAAPGWKTTQKTRFVASGTHLLRVDCEQEGLTRRVVTDIIDRIETMARRADAIVLSDYAKGVVTDAVIDAVMRVGRRYDVPVVVDPKRANLADYAGCAVMTPNKTEISAATGVDVNTDSGAERAAGLVADQLQTAVLLTRAEQGVLLRENKNEPRLYDATRRFARDVSGAGDTVVAAMALSIASGMTLTAGAAIANAAAGVSVSKLGTATVSSEELALELESMDIGDDVRQDAQPSKIWPADALSAQRGQWRNDGLLIGFTNGCFDLLHPGHVKLLKEARSRCDRLIVGLNTDASVRRLKGSSRPLQDERARAEVLESLAAVDAVVYFDDDTPLSLIKRLCPDRLFKGADYALEDVVGAEFVIERGGDIELIALEPQQSTTRLIERSRSRVDAALETLR